MLRQAEKLLGAGALFAWAGAVLGSGAFTTREPEQAVTVETIETGNAGLALAVADECNGTSALIFDGGGRCHNVLTRIVTIGTVTNESTPDGLNPDRASWLINYT